MTPQTEQELVGIVNADDEEEAVMRHVMREKMDLPAVANADSDKLTRPKTGSSTSVQPAAANGMFGLFSPEES